ncbi:MAG: hypothetical protein ACYC2Y_02900 [Armatimonadota bacterium]
MPKLKEKFIVDAKGKAVGVILDMSEYRSLTSACEELESIRAYDRAKESRDVAVPFDQATEEIEHGRK